MDIVALIHTEGVLLFNRYFVLELAYTDILGINQHFLIKSPMCYTRAKKYNKYIDKSLEVIMCTSDYFQHQRVYKFSEIVRFLKDRYTLLQSNFGCIRFGYKGKSFQSDILKKCCIPCVNIEIFGVPSIQSLMTYYPTIKKNCLYHKKYNNKCAKHILELITMYF